LTPFFHGEGFLIPELLIIVNALVSSPPDQADTAIWLCDFGQFLGTLLLIFTDWRKVDCVATIAFIRRNGVDASYTVQK